MSLNILENSTESFLANTTVNLILKSDGNKNVSTHFIPSSTWSMGKIQISFYAVIFLLAVVGNSLVILTLVQNRRMRTITNLFLLNLAFSDLLLGVLCMPFTLVGALLRDFIFGEFMCKILPYLQGKYEQIQIVYAFLDFSRFFTFYLWRIYSPLVVATLVYT